MSADRRLLVGLAALVAVLAVVLTVVTVTSGGSPKAATAATPAPTSSAPATTAATPTTVTTPTTAATPTTAPASSTTGAPATVMDVPVTAAGALLAPPAAPDVRHEDAPNDCASLVDSGWQSLDCNELQPGAGGITYLIEVNPSPSYIATRAYVFRRAADGSQHLILQAEDDNGSRYVASEVEASVAQTGEAHPVLLVGFLSEDGNHQAVDIVRASGDVAAHLDLANGVVIPAPNGLQTWSATAGGPYTHDTLRDDNGAWRIVSRTWVGPADVPHADNVLA